MENKKTFVSTFFDILNIILIIFTIFLLFIAIFDKKLFLDFINYIGEIVKTLGYYNLLIIFFVAMIESFPAIGAVLPGQMVMLIVGGFFGQYHLFLSIISGFFGAILGNFLGYILGIKYGDIFFERYGIWFGIGQTEQKYLEKAVEKNGAFFMIFAKFHSLTRSFIPFIAGSMKMSKKKFWLYNSIGSLLWASVMLLIGIKFVENREKIIEYIQHIFTGIFILVIFYFILFKRDELKKYIQEKESEMEKITGIKKN